MMIITAISAFIVLVVCITLVLHKDYEDGLVGRIALAFLGLSALGRVAGIFEQGFQADVSPVGMILWPALAVFFARHLYYFLRRRYGFGGIWRESDRAQTAGKQRSMG